MILVTHAIVGGAVGRFLPGRPILAFCLAFISHFFTDAIPHWHYPLFSLKKDEKDPMHSDMLLNKWFVVDLFSIGIDFLAGLMLSLIFFHPLISFDSLLVSVLAGVAGGVAPDALEFAYWKMPNWFLTRLTGFHLWIHSKIDIDSRHLLGITTQALFAAAVITGTLWLTK